MKLKKLLASADAGAPGAQPVFTIGDRVSAMWTDKKFHDAVFHPSFAFLLPLHCQQTSFGPFVSRRIPVLKRPSSEIALYLGDHINRRNQPDREVRAQVCRCRRRRYFYRL
jgi:hypothetical protein